MEEWRNKAAVMLPELAEEAEEAVNLMSFWIELWYVFEEAYQSPDVVALRVMADESYRPPGEDFIRRVYAFADWCVQQDGGRRTHDHLPTCVSVCFYEHIPTCPAARIDMPRWFSREDVALMKRTFSYFLTEKEFEDLLALFPQTPTERRKAIHAKKKRK